MFRFPSLLSVFISFLCSRRARVMYQRVRQRSGLTTLGIGQNLICTAQKIQHVVLIAEENRSFDNLFATFPRAHGATVGHWKTANGERKQYLKAGNLYLPTDITHCNAAFKVAYDGVKWTALMTNITASAGPGARLGDGKPVGAYAYEYVDLSLIEPGGLGYRSALGSRR